MRGRLRFSSPHARATAAMILRYLRNLTAKAYEVRNSWRAFGVLAMEKNIELATVT